MANATVNITGVAGTSVARAVQPGSAFVTSVTSFGNLRNDQTAIVGFKFTVGSSPLLVTAIGRWKVTGNTQTHSLTINRVSDDVAIATVSIATSGAPSGAFIYGILASPVVLSRNTAYYCHSSEVGTQDQWHDDATGAMTLVATSNVATENGSDFFQTPNHFALGPPLSFGPVNFIYEFSTLAKAPATGVARAPSVTTSGNKTVNATGAAGAGIARAVTVSIPSAVIPLDFFGITINGPIETNIGGTNRPLIWPAWNPTTWRAIDNFGGVPPTYSYTETISGWIAVETSNGTFNWSLLDLVWAKLISKGVTSVVTSFQAIPNWANGGVANKPPTNMADLTDWVTTYLTRAASQGLAIKYFENMNEANNYTGFYTGTVAQLVTMQQTIYNACKAFDPTIQVLSPPVQSLGTGFNPTAPSGGHDYMAAFLDAGGGAYCDIIAWHGYPTDVPTGSIATYKTKVEAFIAMLASKGQGSKPLWNTEFSTLTADHTKDAIYIAATSFVDWSLGVKRKYYYSYDSGSPADQLWEPPTVSAEGFLNTAGIAYQQVVTWLVGATMTVPVSNAGVVWECQFSKPGNYTSRAVWTSDGSTPSYTKPSWATQYRTLAGGLVTGLGATVTIGASPILFEGTSADVNITPQPAVGTSVARPAARSLTKAITAASVTASVGTAAATVVEVPSPGTATGVARVTGFDETKVAPPAPGVVNLGITGQGVSITASVPSSTAVARDVTVEAAGNVTVNVTAAPATGVGRAVSSAAEVLSSLAAGTGIAGITAVAQGALAAQAAGSSIARQPSFALEELALPSVATGVARTTFESIAAGAIPPASAAGSAGTVSDGVSAQVIAAPGVSTARSVIGAVGAPVLQASGASAARAVTFTADKNVTITAATGTGAAGILGLAISVLAAPASGLGLALPVSVTAGNNIMVAAAAVTAPGLAGTLLLAITKAVTAAAAGGAATAPVASIEKLVTAASAGGIARATSEASSFAVPPALASGTARDITKDLRSTGQVATASGVARATAQASEFNATRAVVTGAGGTTAGTVSVIAASAVATGAAGTVVPAATGSVLISQAAAAGVARGLTQFSRELEIAGAGTTSEARQLVVRVDVGIAQVAVYNFVGNIFTAAEVSAPRVFATAAAGQIIPRIDAFVQPAGTHAAGVARGTVSDIEASAGQAEGQSTARSVLVPSATETLAIIDGADANGEAGNVVPFELGRHRGARVDARPSRQRVNAAARIKLRG